MRPFYKLIIISFLCISNSTVYSQNKRFHHITSKDGLSQSEVYCFLKDSRGFMWFGTVDGLNRFDGYEIKIFNIEKNNPTSLSNNTIRSILEDKFGRIWIGTDDGLNMYNPKSETIEQIIPVSISSQKLSIRALLIYNEYLYLGTERGLFRIKIKESYPKEQLVDLQKISLNSITKDLNFNILTLKQSNLGGFWLQTSSTICRIIIESYSSKAVNVETVLSGSSFGFFDLIEDSTENLWITTTAEGLLRYNLKSKEKTFFKSSDTNFSISSLKCSSIVLDNNGNIWVGTFDNGINLIPNDQKNNYEIQFKQIKHNPYNPSSLNSNLIRKIYLSSDNILWVGTIGAGINYHDVEQKNFNHFRINSLTNNGSNFIRAVFVNNDNLWAGTHSNGLYEIDKNTRKIKKLGLGNMSVFYIAHFEDDRYFVCTEEGLFFIKYSKGSLKILNQLKTKAAFYITKGNQNYYWLATYQGLFRLKILNDQLIIDKNYPLITFENSSPENCRVLYFDHDKNELLVGTEGGGLHILRLDENQEVVLDKKYKSSSEKGAISNNYIRSIIKDSFGNIWIGTYEGLNLIQKNKITGEIVFKVFTKKDGLPNNMINSILEDNEKCLWIGTNNGLSRFSITSNSFLNYFESDGIQSNEFSEHSTFKTNNGEIVMGGINGITTFFPSKITKSYRLPQTTITDFYIDNIRIKPSQKVDKHIPLKKGIAISDTITLLPNQNNIGFSFSSMLFPNVEKVKYAFMLEGFDKNWQYTDESTKYANYTNLDFGKYYFRVKSSNGDGIWEENGEKVFIHILTPFKYSWYAYTIYALIIILLLVFSSYYSIIRYNTKNKLLLEKEHNKKIQSLNKLRTQFFINISHDLRTPLTLIKGPLESVIKEKNLDTEIKEKLILVKRNVNRLNYLIEQLLDVRRAEKEKLKTKIKDHDFIEFTKNEISHFNFAIQKKGLKYKVSSTVDELIVGFDKGMLSKVYFNLISNAIKYTDSGKIDILIETVHKKSFEILKNSNYETFVKVEVKDTGKGIAKNQLDKVFKRFYQEDTTYGKGYGIGLSHSFQLIDAHNGYIEADSEENQGTTIRFFIPKINQIDNQQKETIIGEDDIYRSDDSDILNKIPSQTKKTLKTILVVEDNADMRIYLKSELSNTYHILEAEDGIRGLRMAENQDVDLIVSDVMMPNMDGMTFCKKVKSNIKTSHIPFILLTAKTDKKSKYDGIETGADDYISKPFEIEYLALRIKNLLDSREQLRKIFQSRETILEPSSVTLNSIDEKFLNDLLKALEKGIPESEFSVSSLETDLGMSHSNFYRKVKSLTGKSGKELLNEMRMKRAKQLLLDNDNIRIDEISTLVGFSNPKYFGKTFKETFGISPSEMKKSNKSSENEESKNED